MPPSLRMCQIFDLLSTNFKDDHAVLPVRRKNGNGVTNEGERLWIRESMDMGVEQDSW